jgi:hypothetical protein
MHIALLVAALLPGLAPAPQSPAPAHAHHAEVDARGARAMGFDQARTVHHFRLFADGGAIEVTVKEPADRGNLDAIRSHLPHIAHLFGEGRFDLPMLVHARVVPGTRELAQLKGAITYRYVETPAGGRVDITTRNPDALAALHRFLAFQIADHATGDPTTVGARP